MILHTVTIVILAVSPYVLYQLEKSKLILVTNHCEEMSYSLCHKSI